MARQAKPKSVTTKAAKPRAKLLREPKPTASVSVVEGSGTIDHPEQSNDAILFRNTFSQIEQVNNLDKLTDALGVLVETFHVNVQRTATKLGINIKDYVSFEIIQGEVKDDDKKLHCL